MPLFGALSTSLDELRLIVTMAQQLTIQLTLSWIFLVFSWWIAADALTEYLTTSGWLVMYYEPAWTEWRINGLQWVTLALLDCMLVLLLAVLVALADTLTLRYRPYTLSVPDFEMECRSLAAKLDAPTALVAELMRIRMPLNATGDLRSTLTRELVRWCREKEVPPEKSLGWMPLVDFVVADTRLSRFHERLATVNGFGMAVRQGDAAMASGTGLYGKP
jgi:hypothetical protein